MGVNLWSAYLWKVGQHFGLDQLTLQSAVSRRMAILGLIAWPHQKRRCLVSRVAIDRYRRIRYLSATSAICADHMLVLDPHTPIARDCKRSQCSRN